jgi:hypothetical protein
MGTEQQPTYTRIDQSLPNENNRKTNQIFPKEAPQHPLPSRLGNPYKQSSVSGQKDDYQP